MIIYIKPLSMFPELHSDTIFGAIISSISQLHGETIVNNIIGAFESDNPPFTISSAFPCIIDEKNSNHIRFYPKIIFSNESDKTKREISEKYLDNLKSYKKIEFLEEDIFVRLINGEITEDDIIVNLKDYYSYKGLLMNEKPDMDIYYGENIVPNNRVNRQFGNTEIFYSSGMEYKNMGLFILAEFSNEKFKIFFEEEFKFLQDKGFGKDVSIGRGQFEYELSYDGGIALDNENSDYYVTLSRFIPTEDDLNSIDQSYYDIGFKRGISSSKDIRKQVRFFKEGSSFIFNNKKDIYGQIVHSGDKSPAVEYGYAFLVGGKK